jgi:hypothetical protein
MTVPLIYPRRVKRHVSVAGAVLVAALVVACDSSMVDSSATARGTEVPIGGVRPEITSRDLELARERMPGGLVEPCWLPAGFELVHVVYGAPERTTDLYFQGGPSSLHVWQTLRSREELGTDDPVALGSPGAISTEVQWHSNSLSSAVVEYSARLPDGRTISVDSDLAAETMELVLQNLCTLTQLDASD